MEHRNQVPNLTPKARAAKRRSLIASIFLTIVLVGCVVLTILKWKYFR